MAAHNRHPDLGNEDLGNDKENDND
jgi:hypothetical protein